MKLKPQSFYFNFIFISCFFSVFFICLEQPIEKNLIVFKYDSYIFLSYYRLKICILLLIFIRSWFFRFNINLKCGGDTAFHFDARFSFGSDRNVIVRNSQQNGSWGPEERQSPYFPFNYNQFFDMIILVEHACIKVFVG